MSGIGRTKTAPYQRIPEPGAETAQESSSVYQERYGSLEMPATMYAMADTPLRSVDDVPSVATRASNASIVNRFSRMVGLRFLGGVRQRETEVPPMYQSPYSSKFNPVLVGPHLFNQWNDAWYIAYPAATVMNGGKHNLGLSERVPQLVTRSSGGPGPATMGPSPRFSKVQKVPRYSTLPQQYPTTSTKG